eukprot:gnl/MRDRNA2_/MRDRNA2_109365_c0_seq1.p1 gnl/MRDRNA2_/MRDRNA2_109365_c0~~gnl/MRDRNA2_/MRDRNA2_109365_c0_seq1.p1  ORF type:complete len:752 (+),score=202.97 gnl/MRDRNA2_/MRDRNA2_109365_c0_seq1:42-2258(+)
MIPKGKPFDKMSKHLSVYSFNLLAPAYVRPVDKRTGKINPFATFGWIQDGSLDWEVRQPKILEEIRSCQADIIALQEVQFEDIGDGNFGLPSWLQLPGYAAKIADQETMLKMVERNERVIGNPVPVGCALFYKKSRLQLAHDKDTRDHAGRVAACFTGVKDSDLAGLGPLVVISVHQDANSEEVRAKHLVRCLHLVREMGARDAVITGDMNSEFLPGSCVRALLHKGGSEATADQVAMACAMDLRRIQQDEKKSIKGKKSIPTEDQLREWANLEGSVIKGVEETRVQLSNVPTGPTRSMGPHGRYEINFLKKLDHILYTNRSLRLHSVWSALEADEEAAALGLPCYKCPSDHFPIAAAFEIKPQIPLLNASDRDALVARLQEVDRNQVAQWTELTEKLEQEIQEVVANVMPSNSSTDLKKMVKHMKPPAEIIASIQSRKEKERQFKAEMQAARQQIADTLSESELDALEFGSNLFIPTWVQEGAIGPKTTKKKYAIDYEHDNSGPENQNESADEEERASSQVAEAAAAADTAAKEHTQSEVSNEVKGKGKRKRNSATNAAPAAEAMAEDANVGAEIEGLSEGKGKDKRKAKRKAMPEAATEVIKETAAQEAPEAIAQVEEMAEAGTQVEGKGKVKSKSKNKDDGKAATEAATEAQAEAEATSEAVAEREELTGKRKGKGKGKGKGKRKAKDKKKAMVDAVLEAATEPENSVTAQATGASVKPEEARKEAVKARGKGDG